MEIGKLAESAGRHWFLAIFCATIVAAGIFLGATWMLPIATIAVCVLPGHFYTLQLHGRIRQEA